MSPSIDAQRPIYVAGHRGMVGAGIVRALKAGGHRNILTRSHAELDLTSQAAVEAFFAEQQPVQVYLAAAKVGGIHANDTYPADFIYDNLLIETNSIHAAWRHGVERLLFLGSSCIYPRLAEQPMRESALLTGPLEPTNEPYAIAKIAGIKLCESYNRQHGTDFRSVMPTNLYGPGDNFDLENSHVIPALIRKFHEAKETGAAAVEVWGTAGPDASSSTSTTWPTPASSSWGSTRTATVPIPSPCAPTSTSAWGRTSASVSLPRPCATWSGSAARSALTLPSRTARRASSSMLPGCGGSDGRRECNCSRVFSRRTTGI